MAQNDGDPLASGFVKLMGSQIFLRLSTFGLNQVVTKLLSVEAFGLMSIRFHLINTMILMIGREGFRRGCLRARQDETVQLPTRGLLNLAAMSIPLGVLAAIPIIYAFRNGDDNNLDYRQAVYLQGLAALIELTSEPLYILAQARMQIGLRVSIEAAATIVKILATVGFLVQGTFPEATSISIAQVLFAVTILLGYTKHFWPEWVQSRKAEPQKSRSRNANSRKAEWTWNDLIICSSFTAQAIEKLALAEGTKIAMTWVQSTYQQGIYGLVVNLGSIAARTLLQPFEEAAFLAFSRPLDPCKPATQKLDVLLPLVKIAMLFGCLAIAFGANNTYIALHLLYGAKYSNTEAPVALSWYCGYMLLLAVNGILESFVHATGKGKQLAQGHVALVVINIAQTLMTIPLVSSKGTLGMIAADASGMMLRIAYCTHFVLNYSPNLAGLSVEEKPLNKEDSSEQTEGKTQSQASGLTNRAAQKSKRKATLVPPIKAQEIVSRRSLWLRVFPQGFTLFWLCSAYFVSAVSNALFFGHGSLENVIKQRNVGFGKAVIIHGSIQVSVLAIALLGMYRSEQGLLLYLHTFRRKQA